MPQPTHILFIGNSFTQRNDLPLMLTTLAATARPARKVETRRVIANGMPLKAHWARGAALEQIRRPPLDYVVLQEQSTLPLKNRVRMHESVRTFDEAIKAAGATTVLYMTWARRHEFGRQDELADAYLTIGRELRATVVPAGLAWQSALREDPSLVLHDKDGSHPNPLGTYLAACVFYATLFGRTPEGLSHDLPVVAKEDEGRIRLLQQVAWRTVDATSDTNSTKTQRLLKPSSRGER
jgi:hypothetical protein